MPTLSVRTEPMRNEANAYRPATLIAGIALVTALIGATIHTQQSALMSQAETAKALPADVAMRIVPTDASSKDAPWPVLTGDSSN